MLVVAVHPLPAASSLSSQDGEAAVLFVQPIAAKSSRPLRAALMDLFGLTSAEAVLAVALLAQPDLEEAAKTCGITIGTARTRLKAVFAKTGERSQAGLVRLLSVLVSVTGSNATVG
jgi:DNA-binding CsgD family transcriptional regulator